MQKKIHSAEFKARLVLVQHNANTSPRINKLQEKVYTDKNKKKLCGGKHMAWQQAVAINLSESEEKILTQIKVGTHSALHLKKRAEIILLASSGETNNAIEKIMNIDGATVSKWRKGYAEIHEEIARTENESPRKLRATIESTLAHAPRSGAPATFTDKQVARILALSCEQAQTLNLPFSHRTPTLLQIEVIKRGIVDSISAMHLGRFLKRERFVIYTYD